MDTHESGGMERMEYYAAREKPRSEEPAPPSSHMMAQHESKVIRELRADLAVMQYEKADMQAQLRQLNDMFSGLIVRTRESEMQAKAEIESAIDHKARVDKDMRILQGRAAEERDTFETLLRQRALVSSVERDISPGYISDVSMKRIVALEKGVDAATEKYVKERKRRQAAESTARYERERRLEVEDICRGLIDEMQSHVSHTLGSRGHSLAHSFNTTPHATPGRGLSLGLSQRDFTREAQMVRPPSSRSVLADLGLG